MSKPDIIALFSGGLDSILAAKVLERQGLSVRCLHFTTPFFGSAKAVPYWHNVYGLDIISRDVSEAFAAMRMNASIQKALSGKSVESI